MFYKIKGLGTIWHDDLLDLAEQTGDVYEGTAWRMTVKDIGEEPWEIEYEKYEGKFRYSDADGFEFWR